MVKVVAAQVRSILIFFFTKRNKTKIALAFTIVLCNTEYSRKVLISIRLWNHQAWNWLWLTISCLSHQMNISWSTKKSSITRSSCEGEVLKVLFCCWIPLYFNNHVWIDLFDHSLFWTVYTEISQLICKECI